MGNHFDDRSVSNPAPNRAFSGILEARLSRRQVLRASIAGLFAAGAGGALTGCATGGAPAAGDTGGPLLGFQGVPVSRADAISVPPGYRVQVLYAWGDATGVQGAPLPVFRPDASNTAAEQALQAGMHHDAVEYFPLPQGSRSASRALLAINHEYTDDGMLHADGMRTWNAAKVVKSQHAHGVSVIEIERDGAGWKVVRPSAYARRITGRTPVAVSGPAAGHPLLRTRADPEGRRVLGTLNNCAAGVTPWGTYLACEENFHGYFANARGTPEEARYGITAKGFGYRWHEHDPRFDAQVEPNEPNRFGWVTEIDPYDPQSTPVKRTALGRFKHEGAFVTLAKDGRAVAYMGDDERFEYIYKFVSRDRHAPGDRAANRNLLDHGTLYVARFDADGRGAWLPLVAGQGPLTAANGFAGQAEVCVQARRAADLLGATSMDRPEWIAVHPRSGEVYCTLTNNSLRGREGRAAADAANPRAGNVFGHIIRWREAGGDAAAAAFEWDVFALAGDPQHADAARRGNVKGDAFGSPDGLWFDPRGVLWIQTDVSGTTLNKGDYERLGNNMMLAADPRTGEVRRFLVGPSGCEVTGCVMSPDLRTVFISIQHPGETPSERTDPDKPRAVSNWPDFRPDGRPRSATLAITREDGGVIGA
jgi:secreted PhoX family phosphatase